MYQNVVRDLAVESNAGFGDLEDDRWVSLHERDSDAGHHAEA